MDRLAVLSAYIGTYLAGHPAGTAREAREWMEQTDVAATTAATLASRGYTPAVVAARTARAYGEGDERDVDRVIDQMLYGPDVN